MFDIQAIRAQFPFLEFDPSIVFLDTAASSQKPLSVIDGVRDFYIQDYANIHRGSYPRSDRATTKYEQTRKKVAEFIGAGLHREIVFTKNATESCNLVAHSLADGGFLQKGDRVILTEMEHHANIVPWLQLQSRIGIDINYIRITKEGDIDINHADELLQKPCKLLAVSHVSNVLGTINDVKTLCKKAHEKGVLTFVDGSQSVPHFPVNVQDMNCDFFVFSSHKMYGPGGVGVLFGKMDLLKKMPPFLGGGDMIRTVSQTEFSVSDVPHKFEAGTPPIVEVYGLGLACDFLKNLGMENVFKHDRKLTEYAYHQLSLLPFIRIISHKKACGLVTFTMQGMNEYDVGDELGERNICVRVGQHCAHPLLEKLCLNTTIRASFGVYTVKEEIDTLCQALREIAEENQINTK